MLPKKIKLNNRIRTLMVEQRKERNLSADYISEQIGHSKGWLSQIENGRLQNIKKQDLIKVFTVILNKSSEYIEKFLDDQLMYIDATQKQNIINENNDILDLYKMIEFDSSRGHFSFAAENLNEIVERIMKTDIHDIENSLESIINNLTTQVVDWFIRANRDFKSLFSDEYSFQNLYILIEQCYKIYSNSYQYYGLNKLTFNEYTLNLLKEKLNNNYILKPISIVKDINDYSNLEINDFVLNFDALDYMVWKYKTYYTMVKDPMPLTVAMKQSSQEPYGYKEYDDIKEGLTEKEYLMIIRQIYEQFVSFYGKYKATLSDLKEMDEDYQDLEEKYENLCSEIEALKKQLKT